VTQDVRVSLWDKINKFTAAKGGDMSRVSSEAMSAVAEVEREVDRLVAQAIEEQRTAHTLHSCNSDGCFVCEGGLASCDVCYGGEASLLPTCPGYPLTFEATQAICRGEIKTVADLAVHHRVTRTTPSGAYRARHGDVGGGLWLRATVDASDSESVLIDGDDRALRGEVRRFIWEGWTIEPLPDSYYHLKKDDRVIVWDPEPGVRPDGTPVVSESPWVPGRVEFVCDFARGPTGYVSVYCDDGRGRRCVPPNLVRRA
jgi:hypothetical protein